MRVNDVLVLAYTLSILNYYLGVLLYAAPLPASVKRFGIRIAYHGLVSALLSLLYWSIVYGVEKLFGILGLSWSSLTAFMDRSAVIAASIYSLALGVAGFRTLVLSRLPKEAASILRLVEDTVYRNLSYASFLISLTEAVVKVLARLVYNYWSLLLALGILLYSLPAGLGRRAGASLIAASIVLYLGLPLLPAWVDMWLGAVARESPVLSILYGYRGIPVYWVWGGVYDALSKPVAAGVVVLERGGVKWEASMKDGYYSSVLTLLAESGEYILAYEVGEAGYRFEKLVEIPSDCRNEQPPMTVFEAFIALLKSIVRDVKFCRIDLELPNAVVPSDKLLVYWSGNVTLHSVEYREEGGTILLSFHAVGVGTLTVCASGCSLNVNTTASLSSGKPGCISYTVDGDEYFLVNATECTSGFRSGGATGLIGGIASLLLHELPLAFNIYAIAYATAVWSYLGLLTLLIYGFGRVFGETAVLPFRIRY